MSLRAEFSARFPAYQQAKDQHAQLHMALGARNPIAINAAHVVLQQDAAQAAAVAGMLDDAACLIGLPVQRGPAKTVLVPLDEREETLAALADDSGIVVADGISVSLATVARIAVVPAHGPLLARMARRDGMHEPWTGSVLGFLTDFRDTLNNLLAGRGRGMRDEIVAAAVLDLQRYAAWLVGLALPSPADVLCAWNSTLPTLEHTTVADIINGASMADWEHCCTVLCDWITVRAHAAAQQLADTAWSARHVAPDEIHARTSAAMARVATAYLRLRYLDVPHLYHALLAVDNYLTCEVRVAYTRLVPNHNALHSRAAQPSMQYTAGPTPTGTPAVVDESGAWYAGRIIERLRATPAIADALKTTPVLSHDSVQLMLFAAMTWRWIYITHIMPKMLRTMPAANRVTASLEMFTRPDVPARTPAYSNTPELLDTMRLYMRSVWNVRTIDALSARSAIALTLPHGGEPTMPVSILVGPLPLNSPVLPPVVADEPENDDEPRKRTRTSDDGSARKFRRRQLILAAIVCSTPAPLRGPTCLPRTAWGDYAHAHSNKVPQPRDRSATVRDGKEGLASMLPPVPLLPVAEDDPAMPLTRKPQTYMKFSKPDVIAAHMLAVASAHTEVLDKEERGNKEDDAECVRPRQLVALYAYWMNQCQSAVPGVRIPKRTREVLMPQLQRDLGMERSRGRHLRVQKKSALYPLARKLRTLERRHINVTDTLFDTPGSPVLHVMQA